MFPTLTAEFPAKAGIQMRANQRTVLKASGSPPARGKWVEKTRPPSALRVTSPGGEDLRTVNLPPLGEVPTKPGMGVQDLALRSEPLIGGKALWSCLACTAATGNPAGPVGPSAVATGAVNP